MKRLLALFVLFIFALALPALPVGAQETEKRTPEAVRIQCSAYADTAYLWYVTYRRYVDKAAITRVMYDRILDTGQPFPQEVQQMTLKAIDIGWDQPTKLPADAGLEFYIWCRDELSKAPA